MAFQTGNGTTYTFAGVTADATAIRCRQMTRGTEDISLLATTGAMIKGAHDLYDAGGVDMEYLADPAEADAIVLPTSAAGTLTVTFATDGTWAGTAIVTSSKPPDFVNNEYLRGAVGWDWDGNTDPVFTDAT